MTRPRVSAPSPESPADPAALARARVEPALAPPSPPVGTPASPREPPDGSRTAPSAHRSPCAAGRSPGGSLSLKGLLAQQQTASQGSPNKLEEVAGGRDLNLTGSEFENSFDANPVSVHSRILLHPSLIWSSINRRLLNHSLQSKNSSLLRELSLSTILSG